MLKKGDRVRRGAEWQGVSTWPHLDKVCEISSVRNDVGVLEVNIEGRWYDAYRFEIVEPEVEKKLPPYVKHVPAVQEHDELVGGTLTSQTKFSLATNVKNKGKIVLSGNSGAGAVMNKIEVLELAAALSELAQYMED